MLGHVRSTRWLVTSVPPSTGSQLVKQALVALRRLIVRFASGCCSYPIEMPEPEAHRIAPPAVREEGDVTRIINGLKGRLAGRKNSALAAKAPPSGVGVRAPGDGTENG